MPRGQIVLLPRRRTTTEFPSKLPPARSTRQTQTVRLTNRTLDQIHSPIGAAFGLLALQSGTRPLLNLSQAAPSFPTAPVIADHIATVAASDDGGRYCPQQGLPELRDLFAAELSRDYQGTVGAEQILITAGCNQAFCLVSSAIAEPGDEVLLPVPFYFNHDMWLKLDGVVSTYVEAAEGVVPTVEEVRATITDQTKAIVLVTPGNPTGAIVPGTEIEAWADLAAEHDVLLILDETYRSNRQTTEPAHGLFARPGWDDHVVSLHSFSKDLAIPGYRVGAVVGRPDLIAEAMKLLDCVAICAPRIGQEAVIAGLRHATDWRAEQAARIAEAQTHFEAVMADEPGGFKLEASGAYFGWVRHPFDGDIAESVVRRLVVDHDILVIPGSAFTPQDESHLRFSFANLSKAELDDLATRLKSINPDSESGF